jgi:hypothetical protein
MALLIDLSKACSCQPWAAGFTRHAVCCSQLAFYNGFIPNFARLGSWNVVMFLTLEQVRMRTCCTR